ncbi:Hypothetical predicted protein [Pelobates cultripes]|uniref:Uncharacterized protein n=1 Tax=Pelobates cultripes TaxID=61616 RepID=A0AAD1WWB3_PELCU|nr:Hypothetical predicted protein [Pelobates cultripes]
MSRRNSWNYPEVQKNILPRFEKEWQPPTAPRSTPMTCFSKKKSAVKLPLLKEEPTNFKESKKNRVQEVRLCYRYNLQINDLNALRNKLHERVKVPLPKPKPTRNGFVTYAVHQVARTFAKTPKMHAVVLQYGGPEVSNVGVPFFIEKGLFKEKNPIHLNIGHNSSTVEKTFHIEMPQNRLRVGNLGPGKWQTELLKLKKKDIFKI